MRQIRPAILQIYAAMLVSAVVGLPTAPVRAAEVLGIGNFSHIVANLERSMDFYGRVLELVPNVAPTQWSDNPAIMRLGNTLGAESRITTFSIPGAEFGVELIEYRNIERQPVQARFQDPGASVLQLRVRDLDPVLERLGASAGRIWTPSGEPISLGENARIIFLQDPDGFFVELIENNTAATDVEETRNVVGASFELIIEDSESNAAFYRRGFAADPGIAAEFDATELLNDTVGAHGAGFKRTGMEIPGSRVAMAFLEFRNITRKALATRVQDPGTPILQVFVDDVPGMTLQLVDAGGTLVTAGGPVDLGGGRRLSIVRGPNNLFLELMPPRARR